MGHEHYRSLEDATGTGSAPMLARRLLETGQVDSVHVYSNIVTVDLHKGYSGETLDPIIEDLYIYYRPGFVPPPLEMPEEEASAATGGGEGASVDAAVDAAASRPCAPAGAQPRGQGPLAGQAGLTTTGLSRWAPAGRAGRRSAVRSASPLSLALRFRLVVDAGKTGAGRRDDAGRGLTLQEAADRLGVHYMTVYRYVRLGVLAAEKTGGTWRIAPEVLEAFIEQRNAGCDPVAGAARQGGRRAPWAERLEHRLIAGDAPGVWSVVEAAQAAGADIEDVYLDIVAPAMVSIGRRWEAGEIDVAVEHRASVIAGQLVGRLGHRFLRRGRSRGTVVLSAPAGERHGLPLALLADLLRGRRMGGLGPRTRRSRLLRPHRRGGPSS